MTNEELEDMRRDVNSGCAIAPFRLLEVIEMAQNGLLEQQRIALLELPLRRCTAWFNLLHGKWQWRGCLYDWATLRRAIGEAANL